MKRLAPPLLACLTLGLAPFFPEPHIVGKLRWVLGGGHGMTAIDVFDLAFHGAPWLWLGVEVVRGGDGPDPRRRRRWLLLALLGAALCVSYAGFFPEGGHSPEKLMRYLDQREVQGLRVAHRYETYLFDADANGPAEEKVTDTKITRVRFGESYPASLFASLPDAVVSELP